MNKKIKKNTKKINDLLSNAISNLSDLKNFLNQSKNEDNYKYLIFSGISYSNAIYEYIIVEITNIFLKIKKKNSYDNLYIYMSKFNYSKLKSDFLENSIKNTLSIEDERSQVDSKIMDTCIQNKNISRIEYIIKLLEIEISDTEYIDYTNIFDFNSSEINNFDNLLNSIISKYKERNDLLHGSVFYEEQLDSSKFDETLDFINNLIFLFKIIKEELIKKPIDIYSEL
jgi:hypothetical protein